jgi:3-oxoadipate enol-lactonase
MMLHSQSPLDESWIEGLERHDIETELGLISVRTGGRSDGPPMVFWPSLMMTGTMWRYQYEHYASEHRVVLIDSPGFGQSEAQRKLIDLRDCSDCLLEILDALMISKSVLVGNSWGASSDFKTRDQQ